MEREPLPLDEPDEDELRAAEALGKALDGRSVGPHLPETALETASLLRFSGSQGQLNAARRAAIRDSLLTNLPTRAPRRTSRWGWLGLWIPAAIGTSLGLVFLVRSLGDEPRAEPVAAESAAAAGSSSAASPPALSPADPVAMRAEGVSKVDLARSSRMRGDQVEIAPAPELAELAKAARDYRAEKLSPPLGSELEQIYAQIDAAASADELQRLEQSSAALVGGTSSLDWTEAESHVVRQDIFCRLAENALRLGQPERALEWARRGVDLDGPPNPLLAQLMAVEGRAQTSLGDRLGAAKSYLRALQMNETLLDEHLDGH